MQIRDFFLATNSFSGSEKDGIDAFFSIFLRYDLKRWEK